MYPANRVPHVEHALCVENATKMFRQPGTRKWLFRLRGAKNGAKKRSPVVAVNNLSLHVRRGEIFGILGPNGSGKSTLVRLIATLLIPDSGTITVFGHDVQREEMVVKRMINRVSVDAAFFKKLSPMENLLYAARLYGVNARQARQQSLAILARLGIKERDVYMPLEDMSRGMQQKVAIARAFLSSPILLLLDEPTTGLDPRSKREVQAFVRELREVHEATILLTTHDMNEAEALCDRIAILDEGRIVALDTPAGLKRLVPQADGHEPTLEDVFMALTGKALVEEDEE
ncbi:MAG: ABC transporter ATP-binding protein [Anaerolineae bacterium]|jgi:ABC-2 type transport system ATP-binding protein|nr:ABC transporter ATP-binding protein [Anaerolineae bacterium]MDH7473653.1 ABC transporter ATP-binding protein [Anaerolineae bacterium]